MLLPTPNQPRFEWIDRNNAIDALHQKFGDRYPIVAEALWETAALWGVTPGMNSIHDSGVFTYVTDSFGLVADGCTAEAQLTQAPNGQWTMSTSYSTRISGGGYACSVWSRKAFLTHEDALLAALDELISRFQTEATDRNSGNNMSNRWAAQKMILQLESEQTPQLTLF